MSRCWGERESSTMRSERAQLNTGVRSVPRECIRERMCGFRTMWRVKRPSMNIYCMFMRLERLCSHCPTGTAASGDVLLLYRVPRCACSKVATVYRRREIHVTPHPHRHGAALGPPRTLARLQGADYRLRRRQRQCCRGAWPQPPVPRAAPPSRLAVA